MDFCLEALLIGNYTGLAVGNPIDISNVLVLFCRYLRTFDEEQLSLYDRLINLPSNDWDIYYWATGLKETPEEFDNIVMDLLKKHTKNEDRESRLTMPDLKP